jgi:spermidine synthase
VLLENNGSPKMNAEDFIKAARVPAELQPQEFGMWSIRRVSDEGLQASDRLVFYRSVGFSSMTMLHHWTNATIHLPYGEVVMEDSRSELQRHLPIWMKASGRILVTGLGLGCVVRGLLASDRVEKITVIEIDREIIDRIGREFAADQRVEIIHEDALKFNPGSRKYDFAWHDIWTNESRHLQLLHAELIKNFLNAARYQGAWQFPRIFKRRMPNWFIG